MIIETKIKNTDNTCFTQYVLCEYKVLINDKLLSLSTIEIDLLTSYNYKQIFNMCY